ncbi:MAG: lysyl oxidase family protein [Candidatus Limnocylindria bacterium]
MTTVLRFLVLFSVVIAAGLVTFELVREPRFGAVIPVPREPVLPDLVTLPLTDVIVGTDERSGEEALRFTATIANVGPGTLSVEARRESGSSDRWAVVQWFDEADGDRTGVRTGANLVFGGHGHEHWHLRFGAAYRLSSVDGTDTIAEQTKAGYCFFDQVRLDPDVDGAPAGPVFDTRGCGGREMLSVTMGLSVGWTDPYQWYLEDQSVTMTGLPDGRYRLTAITDPDGWLRESDETNNETWIELDLGTQADGLRTVAVVDASTP